MGTIWSLRLAKWGTGWRLWACEIREPSILQGCHGPRTHSNTMLALISTNLWYQWVLSWCTHGHLTAQSYSHHCMWFSQLIECFQCIQSQKANQSKYFLLTSGRSSDCLWVSSGPHQDCSWHGRHQVMNVPVWARGKTGAFLLSDPAFARAVI